MIVGSTADGIVRRRGDCVELLDLPFADLGAALDNEDRCPGISSRTSAADVARSYNPDIQKRSRLRSKKAEARMGCSGPLTYTGTAPSCIARPMSEQLARYLNLKLIRLL